MGVIKFSDSSNTYYPLQAFPVGFIYISNSSTSPASTFGGTWTALPSNVFLRNNTTVSLTAAGAATVTVATTQLPSHRHGAPIRSAISSDSGSGRFIACSGKYMTVYTSSTGGGGAHNNIPAYRGCYAWRKTAL